MQSFELLDDYELTGIDYEGNSITVPSQVFIQKDLPFITASFVYTDMSSLLSSASNETQLISPVVSTILNCTTNSISDMGNCVTANLTQPVIISFNLSGQQVIYDTCYWLSILFFWLATDNKEYNAFVCLLEHHSVCTHHYTHHVCKLPHNCNPVCIRSNSTLPVGYWSSEGCKLLSVVNKDEISCQCNHLTHFGILLSPRSQPVYKGGRKLIMPL